jgi:N-acetylglucosamine kinase-like BadF-type ATPase
VPARHILGIDGGQSSTLALLCDQTGILLGIGHGGPSNHVREPGGKARLRDALHKSIQAAFANAGLPLTPVAAACCGMTGGDEYVSELLSTIIKIGNLQIEYDYVTAHAAALAGEPGVIVIAGTGSIAFGVNAAGQRARAGGWAYVMGDEGSGYDLGRQALIAAARACDGRGPTTSLSEAIPKYFEKKTLWDVRMAIHTGEIDRPSIAQLSHLVVAASAAGDEVAQSILDYGGKDLAEAAVAVLCALGMLGQPATVSTVGGVFQAGDTILRPMARHLLATAPRAQIRPPVYPPALGPVLLALQLIGNRIDASVKKQLDAASQILEQEHRKWP